MSEIEPSQLPEFIRTEFAKRGSIVVVDIQVKAYPDEVNYVVYVDEPLISRAAQIGNELDELVAAIRPNSFVIVRKANQELIEASSTPLSDGVKDARATALTRLITARSRVSESQPSLSYVKDIDSNLSATTASRHHLIFGRRGAGKSALLVEAKRVLEGEGALTSWTNMQTLRNETPDRIFLYILQDVLSAVTLKQQELKAGSVLTVNSIELAQEVHELLKQHETRREDAQRLIPRVQRLLQRFLLVNDLHLYIFVDDFYYISRIEQPRVLDMLHGCVRDCNAWLKVASIRHLTRWFQSSPPLGLQTGHDADHINLDVTLQDPRRAKIFLEDILQQYFRRVGISSLSKIFHTKAIDRLVLASGAVPRDFLVLASSSIDKAKLRPGSKLVGAQDVNQAAGDAAQAKLQELEEDMASNVHTAEKTLKALKVVRDFCLDERGFTYFLVSYRDKESWPLHYNILTDLLDVRLIHLVDPGVSDPHSAGHRSEAYMLDLSQFSGSRLKQGIQVLDFVRGKIVSHRTRSSEARKTGDTPLQIIAILRGAPTLDLVKLSEIAPDRP